MLTRFLGTVVFVIVTAVPAAAGDPPVIPLWENGPPGFEGRKGEAEVIDKGTITNIHYPTLTVFLPEPERATGVGIVVAPGGGLAKLGFLGGGVEPARFLADRGFAAFVLKYRLPREPGVPYKFEEHSLQDGQRAVRLVRSKAADFGIKPEKVGMLGFSAGGEVVSITSYRPGTGDPQATDPVNRLDGRPAFQMLVYPGHPFSTAGRLAAGLHGDRRRRPAHERRHQPDEPVPRVGCRLRSARLRPGRPWLRRE